MKPNETSWSTPQVNKLNAEEIGDHHVGTSASTPLREDAFTTDDQLKIDRIRDHFRDIMTILGLDLTDDSLSGTPERVAKMYVTELFQGLNPKNKPKIRLFENKYEYGEMLVQKDISFYSCCEHHFVPIVGKAHVAYISNGQVIGLSKINRIVHYFARRPQVQERLTVQIGEELKKVMQTEDIAVLIEAKHLCIAARGVQDDSGSTITSWYSGKFTESKSKEEFLNYSK